MTRFIGVLLVLLPFLLACLLSGTLDMFFDLTSLVLLLGVTFGGLFFTYGSEAGVYLTLAFKPSRSENRPQIQRVTRFYDTFSRFTLGSAIVGVSIAVIALLESMGIPRVQGPALAIALLSLLYALVLELCVVLPMKQSALHNAAAE